MPCPQIQELMSIISTKCRQTLRLKTKRSKRLEISAPFDFKEGPTPNFEGYSIDDLSLMKEKAIASTAVFGDTEDFELVLTRQRPRSRASSYSCGIGKNVTSHARRLSKSYLP